MKRLIFLSLLLLNFSRVSATILPPTPDMRIEQFQITSSSNWVLRLYFYWDAPQYWTSIVVQSDSGSATVTNFSNYYSAGQDQWILVVTPSSLNQALQINPAGDHIHITGHDPFYYYFVFQSDLVFGNGTNPVVLAPRVDQAISLEWTELPFFSYTYSLDNSPGNGLPMCDTAGTCGTMHGKVYGIDLQPYPNGSFTWDFDFNTDAGGNYSTPVYGRIMTSDIIKYFNGSTKTASIVPVSYSIEPDSTIYRDIYLLDINYNGINIICNKTGFAVYYDQTNNFIHVLLPIGLTSPLSNYQIRITNMMGKTMFMIPVDLNCGTLQIQLTIDPGLYIASLCMDGKPLYTTKFMR